VPLRVIEWSIMAGLLARGEPTPGSVIRRSKTWLWILPGARSIHDFANRTDGLRPPDNSEELLVATVSHRGDK
jgi:hypothetical protein